MPGVGSFAQVTKGNLMPGGSIAFRSTNYTDGDDNSTHLQIMPSLGYFFADRIAGGIKIHYAHYSNSDEKFNELLGGVFTRYYFLNVQKRTNVFAEANFALGTEKYSGYPSENKYQFGISAGPAIFINPHFAIETTLDWRSVKFNNDKGRYNSFGLAIGLQVHFPCKNVKKGK